jgi:hypothetical protein
VPIFLWSDKELPIKADEHHQTNLISANREDCFGTEHG